MSLLTAGGVQDPHDAGLLAELVNRRVEMRIVNIT